MSFDLKTHKLNKKGQVVKTQPYRLYVEKGVRKYERPPGSGKFFNEDGTEIVIAQAKAEVKEQKPQKASPLPAQNKKDELASLKADLLGEE